MNFLQQMSERLLICDVRSCYSFKCDKLVDFYNEHLCDINMIHVFDERNVICDFTNSVVHI